MTGFYLCAALLVLVAVAFVIVPLWRQSRQLAIGLALLVPLAAGSLYLLKGDRDALDPRNLAQPTTVDEAIRQLQQRLDREPDDVEGWTLLARTEMTLEKFDLARDAYARAFALQSDDVELSLEYAEAQMRAAPDHRFPPPAVALLEAAVAKQPDSQRGLFFLGMHRRQSNQPAEAAALWERILPTLASETAGTLREQIDAARADAGMPPLPEAAAIVGPTLAITLDISPALRAQAKPGDTVFVFARSVDGSGPPLAAKKITLAQLPVTLSLSDADSPMPAAKLSSQQTVLVMARLSKSGNALPGSGDIESEPVRVKIGDSASSTLTLSRAIP